MKNDVPIKNGIIIPDHELTITTSRAGGPGGQHVNKTDTKITVRWNINTTSALSNEQKQRVLHKLHSQLTTDGELIVANSSSRSQQKNKELALAQVANIIRQALHVPKKRMATRISKGIKEKRFKDKSRRSEIKKGRSKVSLD